MSPPHFPRFAIRLKLYKIAWIRWTPMYDLPVNWSSFLHCISLHLQIICRLCECFKVCDEPISASYFYTKYWFSLLKIPIMFVCLVDSLIIHYSIRHTQSQRNFLPSRWICKQTQKTDFEMITFETVGWIRNNLEQKLVDLVEKDVNIDFDYSIWKNLCMRTDLLNQSNCILLKEVNCRKFRCGARKHVVH